MVLVNLCLLAGMVVLFTQYMLVKSMYHRQQIEGRFRILKSEAMNMLFEDVFINKNLTHSDQLFLRKVVARLSKDIHELRTNRRNYFTLHNFVRLSIEGQRQKAIDQNSYVANSEDVLSLQRRAGESMAMAFSLLVPWLRIQVLYLLVRVSLYVLLLLGLERFRAAYEHIDVLRKQSLSTIEAW
ncbi:MAG: hypothetical protein MUC87_06040 [Bacteroidia bacterium]|jgi:hypothetical protein|nr:hypothetical protein [Bacteroidia bacterium]